MLTWLHGHFHCSELSLRGRAGNPRRIEEALTIPICVSVEQAATGTLLENLYRYVCTGAPLQIPSEKTIHRHVMKTSALHEVRTMCHYVFLQSSSSSKSSKSSPYSLGAAPFSPISGPSPTLSPSPSISNSSLSVSNSVSTSTSP